MNPKFELKLKLVPDKIKEWFGSNEIVEKILDLKHRLNLSGNGLSKLLFLLEIQELKPHYFTWELSSEYGLDRDRAKIISAEVEKSILEPIKDDLKAYGIEPKDLLVFETPSVIRRVGDKYTSVSHTEIPETAPKVVEQSPTPKPVLMKEVPKPTILVKENDLPKPSIAIPKPGNPIPRPGSKIPMPATKATPTRPQVLSPFGFQKETRPVNTPIEFKLGGVPKPSMENSPKTAMPTRPARVELGREETKTVPVPQTKVVGREPIHYTEPKSAFTPQTNMAPLPASKMAVPIPNKPNPKDAVPNPTIH